MTAKRYGLPLLALTLIAGLSISLKTMRYGTAAMTEDARARHEIRIGNSLSAQGFEIGPTHDLVKGGILRAASFAKRPCTMPVFVVVLSASSEGTDLLHRVLSAEAYRIHFVYRGERYDSPPITRYLMQETVYSVLRASGIATETAEPMIEIAEPIACPAGAAPIWPVHFSDAG